jgi:AcrR family transcriptional regulator
MRLLSLGKTDVSWRGVAGQRERVNQKRRTRTALVDAARDLLEQGRTPTIAEVADEALVSRATAYRYFPSQEHLLLDAVLERSINEIDRAVVAAAGSADTSARVEGLVLAIQAEIAANEPGFRKLLELSIAQPSADRPNVASIRGERRLQWIQEALEPIASEIADDSLRRLTSALALCVGAEAFVVLRDLCGLEPDQADETLCWAASALVTAARSDGRRRKLRAGKR